jgi:hypothetical protein
MKLGVERAEILVHGHVPPYGDGEIAVRAAARTERDMDVYVAGHVEISPFVVRGARPTS